MTAALISLSLTGLAYLLGYCEARRVWKRRADEWFTRCMTAESDRYRALFTRYDQHPHGHATRHYPSIDAFLASVPESLGGGR